MAGMPAGTEFCKWIIGPDTYLWWGIVLCSVRLEASLAPLPTSCQWHPCPIVTIKNGSRRSQMSPGTNTSLVEKYHFVSQHHYE